MQFRWEVSLRTLVFVSFILVLGCDLLAEQLASHGVPVEAALLGSARWVGRNVAPSFAPFEPMALRADGPAPVAANDANAGPTVFHEPWWLDAAAPGGWDGVSLEEGGRTVAWWPYAIARHRGFLVSRMPPLAHLLGPTFDDASTSPKHRWLRRMDAVADLAGRLPRVWAFSQTCQPGITDAIGFQAAGFSCATQFSAEIGPGDVDGAWKRLRDKTRNVIRRAQEALVVEDLVDVDEFIGFYRHNLSAAGRTSYYDAARIRACYDAAARRGQAVIRAARCESGALAAAVFFLRDQARLWYFLSTRAPDKSGNGGVSLLVWDGIQAAATSGLTFDLDGIASSGAARFYAGFGADIRPRYAIHRQHPAYALWTTAIDAVLGTARNPFTAP
ncbi:GNAT family N-acetyltransferase [Ramlibacter algicola]|uniref:GNAT family N-acetyltransferase n=1 Tax=Ramlibacter algicola TaxID=2795217 RepID=A0A934UQM4_9BURK|nr:GNAT family N-acetyltransferase [Ramlibacter algicola]MBK0392814.1 GNAT family N-acetyltransferase [Ramlibacter algicola]